MHPSPSTLLLAKPTGAAARVLDLFLLAPLLLDILACNKFFFP